MGEILGGGMSLLGGIAGSKGDSQSVNQTSAPWSVQAPYLEGGFKSAKDIYDQMKGTPFYQGELYAPINDTIKSGLNSTTDLSQLGSMYPGLIYGQAGGMLGAGSDFYDAAKGLSGFSAGDPTQQVLQNGAAYANNPYMDDMVRAASRDVTRNLNENVLPGIDRAAVGSGNVNSTRAGIAAGIAQRGAQDQIGDISAALRGSAYDSGLNRANGDYWNGVNTDLSAKTAGASAFGSVFGSGLQSLLSGQQFGFNNADATTRAGQVEQADQQGQDNAAHQQWTGQDQRATDLLNRYWGIVGSGNWGGTTNTQTTGGGGTAGAIQGSMGGLAGGLGLFNSFGSLFGGGGNAASGFNFGSIPSGSWGF
jgi:hypothetical protein